MAMQGTMVWEVQTTGDDANGGGFDDTYGTPGTDYSYGSNQAVTTYTDLVIDGTTDTDITSATTPFTSAHVGNVINITSGTDFTVQRVQILSVSGVIATCDKAVGTAGATGGNGKLGGALATPGGLGAVLAAEGVSGMSSHMKSGTYSLSSASVNVSGGAFSTYVGALNQQKFSLVGYESTRDDYGTRPEVKANGYAPSEIFYLYGGTSGKIQYIGNIIVDGEGEQTTLIRGRSANTSFAYRCKVINPTMSLYPSYGIRGMTAIRCEGDAGERIFVSCVCFFCTAYGGKGKQGFNSSAYFCVAYGCNYGFNGGEAVNCVAYDCNFGYAPTGYGQYTTHNCIAAKITNVGFGSNSLSIITNSAHYDCTGGRLTSGVSCIDINPVTLSEDPFIDSANNDFRLNPDGADYDSLAGCGLGPLGQTSNLDIGAVQHADPASSGGGKSLIFG